MTLQESIDHAKDVASSCVNEDCSLQHLQLVNWLEELKKLRKEKEVLND